MKKILLGLSCLAAMALSLQASADAKTEAVKRGSQVIKRGQKAAQGARSVVGQGARGTQLNSTANAVKSTGALGSADVLFGANNTGAQKAQAGGQCSLDNYGGVDTSAALAAGLMQASTCHTSLSAAAKSKFGASINRAGVYLKSVGKTIKTALSGQKIQAKEALARGLDKAIDGVIGGEVDYNEAMSRIGKMCNSCPGLVHASLCKI